MFSYHCVLYIFLPLLFSLMEEGDCLKCYVCRLTSQRACGDPFNETEIKTDLCDEDEVCVKQRRNVRQYNGFYLEVNRGCVPHNYCKLMISEHCSVCTGNFCNASSKLRPLIFSSMLWILMFLT